jgi:hypothetical protein
MPKVALTGGIATGKSYVLEQFRRRGVPCLDADSLAHGVTARARKRPRRSRLDLARTSWLQMAASTARSLVRLCSPTALLASTSKRWSTQRSIAPSRPAFRAFELDAPLRPSSMCRCSTSLATLMTSIG